MKTILFLVSLLGLGLAWFALAQQPDTEAAPVSDYPEMGMIPERRMLHIGVVVRDIEASREHWRAFLGLASAPEVQAAGGDDPDHPTHYRGHPTTASAKLAFIDLDNIQIELIEPSQDEPSHWKEFLDTKGEGVHHIGFQVKGLGEQYIENYGAVGMGTVQQGSWDTGEYSYMNTLQALGVTVELLEFYNR